MSEKAIQELFQNEENINFVHKRNKSASLKKYEKKNKNINNGFEEKLNAKFDKIDKNLIKQIGNLIKQIKNQIKDLIKLI